MHWSNQRARLEAASDELPRLVPAGPSADYDVKDPVCDLIMDAAERWATDVAWSP